MTYKNKFDRYPNIEVFVEFLQKVTQETNDPVFGTQKQTTQTKPKKPGKNFNVNATKTASSSSTTGPSKQPTSSQGLNKQSTAATESTKSTPPPTKCILCEGDHQLYACSQFKSLTPDRRFEFVREKKLCFSCLRTGSHSIRWCKYKRPCGIDGCSYKHSRLLHGATPKPDRAESGDKEATNCAALDHNSNSKVVLPIVAVRVRGSDQEEFVNTYAILDPCSNRSFCSTSLVNILGIRGEGTSLSLSTLSGSRGTQAEVVSLVVTGGDTLSATSLR